MSAVQPTVSSAAATIPDLQSAHKKCQDAQSAQFDALLAIFSDDSGSSTQSASATGGTSGSAASAGAGSLGSIFDVLMGENSADPTSGSSLFSSDFTSTFGNTGPLPDFINMLTSQMGLTADQTKALENIAVQNKDINATDSAAVQNIATELAAAGIG